MSSTSSCRVPDPVLMQSHAITWGFFPLTFQLINRTVVLCIQLTWYIQTCITVCIQWSVFHIGLLGQSFVQFQFHISFNFIVFQQQQNDIPQSGNIKWQDKACLTFLLAWSPQWSFIQHIRFWCSKIILLLPVHNTFLSHYIWKFNQLFLQYLYFQIMSSVWVSYFIPLFRS
jgi:hypothetical protein